MDLSSILFFCFVLGSSMAQKPCCLTYPVTWSSVILTASVSNRATTVNIVQNVAADPSQGLLGGEETLYYDDGTAYTVKFIEDFDKRFIYFINGLTCSKTVMPAGYGLNLCVPDDATLIGIDNAPLSGIAIGMETWAAYQDINGIRGNYTLTVLPEDCRPVSELFMGVTANYDPPVPLVASMIYSDFAYGVSQPERYFTVPVYCNDDQEPDVSYMQSRLRGPHSLFFNRFIV